jgi:hypothetical protein
LQQTPRCCIQSRGAEIGRAGRQGAARRADRDQPLVVDDDRHETGVGVGAVPESQGRVAAQYQRTDLRAERGLKPQVQARVRPADA